MTFSCPPVYFPDSTRATPSRCFVFTYAQAGSLHELPAFFLRISRDVRDFFSLIRRSLRGKPSGIRQAFFVCERLYLLSGRVLLFARFQFCPPSLIIDDPSGRHKDYLPAHTLISINLILFFCFLFSRVSPSVRFLTLFSLHLVRPLQTGCFFTPNKKDFFSLLLYNPLFLLFFSILFLFIDPFFRRHSMFFATGSCLEINWPTPLQS